MVKSRLGEKTTRSVELPGESRAKVQGVTAALYSSMTSCACINCHVLVHIRFCSVALWEHSPNLHLVIPFLLYTLTKSHFSLTAEALSRGGCSFSLSYHMVVAEWTDLEGVATTYQVWRFGWLECGRQIESYSASFSEELGQRVEEGWVSMTQLFIALPKPNSPLSPSLSPSPRNFSINFAEYHSDNKTEETYEFEFFDSKATHSADKISFQKATHRREQQRSDRPRKPKSPSLVLALAKSFGGTFFVAGLFKFCQDLLNFVSPQLLKLVSHF